MFIIIPFSPLRGVYGHLKFLKNGITHHERRGLTLQQHSRSVVRQIGHAQLDLNLKRLSGNQSSTIKLSFLISKHGGQQKRNVYQFQSFTLIELSCETFQLDRSSKHQTSFTISSRPSNAISEGKGQNPNQR